MKQLRFYFVVSVTHVAPPEHFVYDRKKGTQQMQITPLEQKLKGEHFVIFFVQVAKFCLVFTGEYVHAIVRVLLRVVADHSIPDIWSYPVPVPDVQRLFSTIVQIFPDTMWVVAMGVVAMWVVRVGEGKSHKSSVINQI